MKWPNSLLSPLLAFLTACAAPAFGADDPPQQANPPVADSAPAAAASTGKAPLVIQNTDGTITIQKEPAKEEGKEPAVKKGLVIRPQVIIPTAKTPAPENK